MPKKWVLVAESSRAKIYQQDSSSSPLTEVKHFIHTESRLHEKDLKSDTPSSYADGTGRSVHAITNSTSPKEHEATVFAKEICHYLDSAHNDHKYKNLVVIAAPNFLGLLRKNLSTSTSNTIIGEINKNLVQQPPDDIKSHIRTVL